VSSFSVGDPEPTLGCTAIDDIDGIITCQVFGSIDTSTAGSYVVTYYAIDSSDNETTLAITYHVIDPDNPDNDIELSAYYSDATGLTGNDLLLSLRTIINRGLIRVSYGDARYILNITDQDPLNPNNVILVYLGTSVSGTWDLGVTWNREHVWPQSLMMTTTLANTSKNIGSDLHNLKPANPSENSSRGNKYYDNATTTVSYAPRAEVRGDLARILFYMVVMYDYLELINSTPTLYKMAMLNTLLQWHIDDPVDDFERNRNDVIYDYQKNRNPFIDYPEFVEMIFGPVPLSVDQQFYILNHDSKLTVLTINYELDLYSMKKNEVIL
jgi:endonuclease I